MIILCWMTISSAFGLPGTPLTMSRPLNFERLLALTDVIGVAKVTRLEGPAKDHEAYELMRDEACRVQLTWETIWRKSPVAADVKSGDSFPIELPFRQEEISAQRYVVFADRTPKEAWAISWSEDAFLPIDSRETVEWPLALTFSVRRDDLPRPEDKVQISKMPDLLAAFAVKDGQPFSFVVSRVFLSRRIVSDVEVAQLSFYDRVSAVPEWGPPVTIEDYLVFAPGESLTAWLHAIGIDQTSGSVRSSLRLKGEWRSGYMELSGIATATPLK